MSPLQLNFSNEKIRIHKIQQLQKKNSFWFAIFRACKSNAKRLLSAYLLSQKLTTTTKTRLFVHTHAAI